MLGIKVSRGVQISSIILKYSKKSSLDIMFHVSDLYKTVNTQIIYVSYFYICICVLIGIILVTIFSNYYQLKIPVPATNFE